MPPPVVCVCVCVCVCVMFVSSCVVVCVLVSRRAIDARARMSEEVESDVWRTAHKAHISHCQACPRIMRKHSRSRAHICERTHTRKHASMHRTRPQAYDHHHHHHQGHERTGSYHDTERHGSYRLDSCHLMAAWSLLLLVTFTC